MSLRNSAFFDASAAADMFLRAPFFLRPKRIGLKRIGLKPAFLVIFFFLPRPKRIALKPAFWATFYCFFVCAPAKFTFFAASAAAALS